MRVTAAAVFLFAVCAACLRGVSAGTAVWEEPMGDSVSMCAYGTCSNCTSALFCGWCVTTSTCMPCQMNCTTNACPNWAYTSTGCPVDTSASWTALIVMLSVCGACVLGVLCLVACGFFFVLYFACSIRRSSSPEAYYLYNGAAGQPSYIPPPSAMYGPPPSGLYGPPAYAYGADAAAYPPPPAPAGQPPLLMVDHRGRPVYPEAARPAAAVPAAAAGDVDASQPDPFKSPDLG